MDKIAILIPLHNEAKPFRKLYRTGKNALPEPRFMCTTTIPQTEQTNLPGQPVPLSLRTF